jgi:SAM-dependent methyltransferase
MTFYRRHVLPCLLHLAMRQKQLMPFRRRVIGAAEGKVLEIGIGSGLNLLLYGPPVRSVIGLEPSAELLRMACGRAPAAAVPVSNPPRLNSPSSILNISSSQPAFSASLLSARM